MALNFATAPEYQYQGITPQAIDIMIGRRQQRHDTAIQLQEAALQEALSRGFVDQSARDEYLQRMKNKFTKVAEQYKGNLSAGYRDILGTVTDVKTDPYIQANQAHLEAYKKQQDLVSILGSNGYVQDDIATMSLYDPETGKYRTTFQPKVYNLQDFVKSGAMLGQERATGVTSDWRNSPGLPGFKERQIGYRNIDAAKQQYLNTEQGQQDVTNTLIAQGFSGEQLNDPRLRGSVEQGMLSTLVGKIEREKNLNYINAYQNALLKLQDRKLDLEEDKFKLKKIKEARKNNNTNSLFTVPNSIKKPVLVKHNKKDILTDVDKVKGLTTWKPSVEQDYYTGRMYGTVGNFYKPNNFTIENNPNEFMENYLTQSKKLIEKYDYEFPSKIAGELQNYIDYQSIITEINTSDLNTGNIPNKKLLEKKLAELHGIPLEEAEKKLAVETIPVEKRADYIDKLTKELSGSMKNIANGMIPIIQEDLKGVSKDLEEILPNMQEDVEVVAPELSNRFNDLLKTGGLDVPKEGLGHINFYDRSIHYPTKSIAYAEYSKALKGNKMLDIIINNYHKIIKAAIKSNKLEIFSLTGYDGVAVKIDGRIRVGGKAPITIMWEETDLNTGEKRTIETPESLEKISDRGRQVLLKYLPAEYDTKKEYIKTEE